MKDFVEKTNEAPEFGGQQKGSGMSSFEGLSGFKDDMGNQTGDDIIPSDKINIGTDQLQGVSATAREPSKNENLQQMYERVLGNTAPIDNADLRNNPFLIDHAAKTNISHD